MDDPRMYRTALTIALLIGFARQGTAQPPDEPRVARLVKTLGSDDFTARRAANLELLKLGAESRKQLELAAESDDPEVRLRASNLLERIAAIRLWEPTSITLKANDELLSQVLADCSRQTGNHVFVGDPYGEFKNARASVELKDKPYWQVLDELAAMSGNHVRIHYDSRMPGVVMAAGQSGKYPTAYSGPIRAQITSAKRAFLEELDYEQRASEVTHTFQMNVQMMWEDRFRLVAYGTQPEVMEAKTDTGVVVSAQQSTSGAWNVASPGTRQISAMLKLNPPPISAKSFSTLRLRWSLVALGDLAICDLQNPITGSELHSDGISLRVKTLDRHATGRVEITLIVARDIAIPDPPEMLFQENTIELFDANGRAFRCQSQNHSLTEDGVEFKLQYLGESAASIPAILRVAYPKLRSKRDLEIVFKDVPLPVARPE